jgi:hypothetical protein
MHNSFNQIRLAVSKPSKSHPYQPKAVGLVSILFALLGCAPEAVRYPQPGMAIWANGKGGTIEGNATLRSGASGYARTCAGFDAYIVPVTPMTTAFIRQHFHNTHNGYSSDIQLQNGFGTFVTSNGGGSVPCRGDGTFTFADLADGPYYVLADIKWLLRWAHRGGTVATVADVRRAQVSTVTIDVSSGTHGERFNVSQ